jgi:hypothetical protein
MTNPLKTALTLSLWLIGASPVLAQDIRSPQEVLQGRPNQLAAIPPHWEVENPVQLQVLFNLKAPVNSPEANAFLDQYVKFERGLPYKVDIIVLRVVAPARFSYAARLSFTNWHDYRVYEQSAAFRKYYYDVWKPHVLDAEELFTLTDLKAGGQ